MESHPGRIPTSLSLFLGLALELRPGQSVYGCPVSCGHFFNKVFCTFFLVPFSCVDSEDQTSEHRVDPVELQIKCGRCQAITPTFADMKLHLLYVHGEEVQVHLKEGAMHEGREAENELVKHAAHYWRQLNERRNLVRCGSCDEEFFSFSKLECHLHAHHQGVITSQEDERELKKEEDVSERSDKSVTLRAGSKFNCILCSGVLNSKQEVLEHWKEVHKCENPVMLWEVLDSK